MKYRNLILILAVIFAAADTCGARRIKDIVDIKGVRGNPLYGIGLVVGLADSGDSTLPSQQMLTNVLRNSGVVVNPSDLTGGNVAIVMVTAHLGPFEREGARLDVDVSSIGDAESLQGGMLLPTQLKGMDGQVYAITEAGGVSTGGFAASGSTGTKVSKNHQTVGRIPSGAIVERAEIATFVENLGGNRIVTLNLRNADFATAERICKSINDIFNSRAVVVDAGTIHVCVPPHIDNTGIVGFIDQITQQDVKVDMPAVVVVNEKTGTIVVGESVGISAVAISQGSLVVKIKETQNVYQPNTAFTEGATTEVVDDTMIDFEEEQGYLIPVPATVTVSDLAKTLNAIGATPRDLIAIFNALKRAGALQAKLEIM